MGYIKKLKNNELVGGTDKHTIYPVTSTEAVFEETTEGGESNFKSQKYLNNHIYGGEGGRINQESITNYNIAKGTLSEDRLDTALKTKIQEGYDTSWKFKGEYDKWATYDAHDVVYDPTTNSSYISLQADNQWHPVNPEDESYVEGWWQVIMNGKASTDANNALVEYIENDLTQHVTDAITDANGAIQDMRSDTLEAYTEAEQLAQQITDWSSSEISSTPSYTDQHPLSNRASSAQVGYFECGTSSTTQASNQIKAVTAGGYALPTSGGAVKIKMYAANAYTPTTNNPVKLQFNADATTLKELRYNGKAVSPDNTWDAGEVISVYYDGSVYQASNAQGGGGKAEKIKYDNSASGLAVTDVQGALDEVGAEIFIDGDSLSMGNPINYIISTSSWVWTSQPSNHYLIKVNVGDKIKVTANSNNTAVCIWLTSNAAPSLNNPAPVVSQSATFLQANESAIITAPQTAEYLYLMGVHNSVEHKPSSVIKVDGIKQIVVDLDENAFRNHADYSNIPITWSLGYVQASDGAIKTMTSGNYYYSQLIPVDENTVCKINAGGSQNVLTVAMYSSDNTTTADLTKSILGTSVEQNLEFVVPDGIAYIRITNNVTTVAQPEAMKAFIAADYVLNKLKEHESEIQELSELTDSLEDRMPSLEQDGSTARYTFTDAESGYYRDTDHAVVDSQYWYHKAIPFDGGENATLYYTSSAGQAAASCFFKVGTSYQRFGQDSGGSSINPVPITVDIPAGTTEILISVNSGVKDTAYAEITIPAYIPEDAVSERMVKELLKKELLSTGLNLKKRRASVSFIFDDGVANDVQIKAIFDNHLKKCGFAVSSPIASRYKTYYDEGFELLAHASSPISNPTEASERAQMETAYDNVVALVGECHGWVTPSSALADQFKPLVYDYYEYGYTVYKGNIATPSESGMTKDMKSYALWRSSVESITLAEQKAIIDYAVANNLMVCFYGHGYNLDNGGNFTSANLNELLSYCDTVGIDVMLPYESVSNFFAFRHNEDL